MKMKPPPVRSKPIVGVFENALLTLEWSCGFGGVNAVVRGWKHPVRDHDEAAQAVEDQMVATEEAQKAYARKCRFVQNWETAWILMNERPEILDEFLKLRPIVKNLEERMRHMRSKEKAKAEESLNRFKELEPTCKRLLEAKAQLDEARRVKQEAFGEMRAAEQRLEVTVGREREAAELITGDHVVADEQKLPISELFVGVFVGMIAATINGVRVRDTPFKDIVDLLERKVSKRQHVIEFERYDYRYVVDKWEHVDAMRARGLYVEDAKIKRESFFEHCRDGSVQRVERALSEGQDCNAIDETGWSGLHHAAANGQIAVIQTLLDAGGKVDIRDANGETPLLSAARRGVDLTEILGMKGIDAKDNDGRTIYILAVQSGSLSFVQNLTMRHIPDKWGWTPLHYAASQGDAQIVEYLLDEASPYAKSTRGETPLDLAHSPRVFNLIDEGIRADPAQCVLKQSGEVWIGSRRAAYRKFATRIGLDSILSIVDGDSLKDSRLKWLVEGDEHDIERYEMKCDLSQIENPEKNSKSWEAFVSGLQPALAYLHDAIARKRTVLVHCDDGKNRCFALLLSYMVTKSRLRLSVAKAQLVKIRHDLELTPAFENGLTQLEEALDYRKLRRLEDRIRQSPALFL